MNKIITLIFIALTALPTLGREVVAVVGSQ